VAGSGDLLNNGHARKGKRRHWPFHACAGQMPAKALVSGELSRSYLTVTQDLTRVMNRLKGLYRSWAIPCAGQKVYSPPTPSALNGESLNAARRCGRSRMLDL
jgi:hypothetical protein